MREVSGKEYKAYKDPINITIKLAFLVAFICGYGFLVYYLFIAERNYQDYVVISRVYSILTSSIGITAVIAVAGLCLNAMRKNENAKYRTRLGTFFTGTAFMLLGLVVILGIASYMGINQILNPFGDEYTYIGQSLNGKAEGLGTKFDAEEQIIYTGHFKANQYDGEGKQYKRFKKLNNATITYHLAYSGSFKNGLYDGQGELYTTIDNKYRLKYSGPFKEGQYDGENGTLYGSGESYYEGTFKDGEFIEGKYYAGNVMEDVTYYAIGIFQNNQLEGIGDQYWNDKHRFHGEFKNGVRDGYGYDFNNLEELVFEGNYIQGEKNGYGIEYDAGNKIFEGEYKNGQRLEGIDYSSNPEGVKVQYELKPVIDE